MRILNARSFMLNLDKLPSRLALFRPPEMSAGLHWTSNQDGTSGMARQLLAFVFSERGRVLDLALDA